MIKILRNIVDIEQFQNQNINQPIGLVPTMGALHSGHLALVKQAVLENKTVVISIFVNPTQFDNLNDLETYPKTLDQDLNLLQTVLSVHQVYVFAPDVKTMYANGVVSQKFDFDGLEHQMEGAFRTGHFDGVGTIVKKLFDFIKPDRAYFGEKDFQQLQVIKKLVKNYSLPVEIVPCKIVREKDGLAMSSRNSRLSKQHRNVVPFIYKTLLEVKTQFGIKSVSDLSEWVKNHFEKEPLLNLEYFMIADENTLKPVEVKSASKKYRAFIAVYAGEVRLIDNISLN